MKWRTSYDSQIQYLVGSTTRAYVKPATAPTREGTWYWRSGVGRGKGIEFGWEDTKEEAKAALLLGLIKYKVGGAG